MRLVPDLHQIILCSRSQGSMSNSKRRGHVQADRVVATKIPARSRMYGPCGGVRTCVRVLGGQRVPSLLQGPLWAGLRRGRGCCGGSGALAERSVDAVRSQRGKDRMPSSGKGGWAHDSSSGLRTPTAFPAHSRKQVEGWRWSGAGAHTTQGGDKALGVVTERRAQGWEP